MLYVGRNARNQMQEHFYFANKKQIIKRSLFTWTFTLLQVIGTIFLLTQPSVLSPGQKVGLLVFVNTFLGLMTIPAILLFINYRKYTTNKKIIVSYNSIKLSDEHTGEVIEMKNSEIVEIRLIEADIMSKMPWAFHSYFSLIDSKNQRIEIPCYLMNITELWLDSLARKISSSKLTRETRFYPIIRRTTPNRALAQ